MYIIYIYIILYIYIYIIFISHDTPVISPCLFDFNPRPATSGSQS